MTQWLWNLTHPDSNRMFQRAAGPHTERVEGGGCRPDHTDPGARGSEAQGPARVTQQGGR